MTINQTIEKHAQMTRERAAWLDIRHILISMLKDSKQYLKPLKWDNGIKLKVQLKNYYELNGIL